MHTMREMELECFFMKDAMRWASSPAAGMARDPPGWKSFWTSMRSRVVMVI